MSLSTCCPCMSWLLCDIHKKTKLSDAKASKGIAAERRLPRQVNTWLQEMPQLFHDLTRPSGYTKNETHISLVWCLIQTQTHSVYINQLLPTIVLCRGLKRISDDLIIILTYSYLQPMSDCVNWGIKICMVIENIIWGLLQIRPKLT